MKWIPKAARGDFGKTLADLCRIVKRTPEAHSLWALVLMFPRVILPASPSKKNADAYSQARIVRERLDMWRRGD